MSKASASLPGQFSSCQQLMRILLLLVSIFGLSAAQAQVLYGSLTGNVTDPSGATVGGAQVEARNQNTGTSQQTTTDGSGIYRFVAILPGTYTVTISNQGFSKQVYENVAIEVNAVRRVDAALSIQKINESGGRANPTIPAMWHHRCNPLAASSSRYSCQ